MHAMAAELDLFAGSLLASASSSSVPMLPCKLTPAIQGATQIEGNGNDECLQEGTQRYRRRRQLSNGSKACHTRGHTEIQTLEATKQWQLCISYKGAHKNTDIGGTKARAGRHVIQEGTQRFRDT